MSYYCLINKKAYKKQNKDTLKKKLLSIISKIKKSRDRYKNLSEEENNKIKEYQKKRYQELIQYKREALEK